MHSRFRKHSRSEPVRRAGVHLVLWISLFSALSVVASGLVAVAPAGASPAYVEPVAAEIVDFFRPPEQRWGSGNRGIDYDTPAGTPVRASAAGTVTFSGSVGSARHVVVLHPDGVRTTYAFLRTVTVARGASVAQGDLVGTTAGRLHFGARVGSDYIDPLTLFATGPPVVHLVPSAEDHLPSEAEERRGLLEAIGSGVSAVGSGMAGGIAWARHQGARGLDLAGSIATGAADFAAEEVWSRLAQLEGMAHYAREFNPMTHLWRAAETVQHWWEQRSDCTEASVPPVPRSQRHIAVLVSGLGSSSKPDAIDDLDTASLGYGDGDVVRFSYKGGSAVENGFGPADTTVDLRESARRLRDLLIELAEEHPGVPVDIIGHSQGGVVARQMLAFEYDPAAHELPEVSNLITLASPHQGSDLATGIAMVRTTVSGQVALSAAGHLAPGAVPRGESVGQLAETSEFMRELAASRLPEEVSVTSIAARGDIFVSAQRSRLEGAENVVVSVDGAFADHSELPGSPQAHREVALALAGMAPTCQGLLDMMADTIVSDLVGVAHDAAGAGAWAGANALDGAVGRALARSGPVPRRRPGSSERGLS